MYRRASSLLASKTGRSLDDTMDRLSREDVLLLAAQAGITEVLLTACDHMHPTGDKNY